MGRATRKSRGASRPRTHLKPGDKVIIRRNPHHAGAEDIVGTVVRFRPGEGFGGCDLVDVRYADPRYGNNHAMPFAPSCLEPWD